MRCRKRRSSDIAGLVETAGRAVAAFLLATVLAATSATAGAVPGTPSDGGAGPAPAVLPLTGTWECRLDPADEGTAAGWFREALPERVRLPGSIQEQGLGNEITVDTPWVGSVRKGPWLTDPRYAPYRQPGHIKVPFFLQPDRHYIGPAWFARTVEVPEAWRGRRIVLFLERAHWTTAVWVDGRAAGSADSLSVPHIYDLTDLLPPGRHRIAIRVDNRMHVHMGRQNAHSITDHTQTNWNGIIGRIELRAGPRLWIDGVQVYPDVEARAAKVRLALGNATGRAGEAEVRLQAVAEGAPKPHRPPPLVLRAAYRAEGPTTIEADYPLGPDARMWDEFHPVLYRLAVEVAGPDGLADRRTVTFGLRHIETRGTQFVLNGRPIFLRGTLECCIFPRTGYPPTDVASWKRVLGTMRAFGLNHVRFHSWCPPEAAFEAADRLGIYFQVEGPFWDGVGIDEKADRYILAETDRILEAYGNHPSFLLMAYGNEPHGRVVKFLGAWVERCRKKDPRRLYTAASGWPQIPQNQYHVMHRPLRLHGRFRQDGHFGTLDYRDVVARHTVPLVSHESGQWCVFPNLAETAKYTGVLKAKNFEIVRDFLKAAGMLDQARDFLMASGKLQVLMYKQEIESFLRTPGLGGFQLLQLHDFPGQGTALVGVLDAFFEEKGYLTAAEHRRYCAPLVPLARLPKWVYTTDERLEAQVDVANYGPADLERPSVRWTLGPKDGEPIASGVLRPKRLPTGNVHPAGRLAVPLAGVRAPCRLVLTVSVEGTPAENAWDVWIYPARVETAVPKDVRMVEALDDATARHLVEGGRVLLAPRPDRIRGDTYGAFAPIFWNRNWFPRQKEHTLGILCDPKHPALAAFPTDPHSGWQWFDLNVRSKPIVMDHLPRTLRPIVQVIDDWNTCRKLGLVFEARVGKGRLLVSAVDLVTDLADRPAARQLRYSLLRYAASEKFRPAVALTVEQVRSLLAEPPLLVRLGARVRADSEQPGYEAALAIDGRPETIWHTRWEPKEDPPPHHLVIDLGRVMTVRGLTYLPRQDMANGRIARFAIYTSTDGKTWGEPVARGTWPNDTRPKEVTFAQPRRARYVKLVAESEVRGRPWTSVAEVDLETAE